jgi:calcium-dependent protein kinase
MGGSSSKITKEELAAAVERAEERLGKIGVSGRYHRSPKKIQDDYVLETAKVLGTGRSGSVFGAKSRQTGALFAVKALNLRGLDNEGRTELKAEVEIFLSMDHPHVARLSSVYETDKKLYLVMERMEGGEILERLQERQKFTESETAHAVRQMLLAVNYIHGRQVVHRDLKLENFMYESKESDHLKLIDFGFSHVLEPNTKMSECVGTLDYSAPEVLSGSYTSQCDLWSLGVITFALLCGHMPFSGSSDAMQESIKRGLLKKKADRWIPISDSAKDFMGGLLVVNPTKRLTAEQALEHPFIKSHQRSDRLLLDSNIVNALCDYKKETHFRRACMSMMAWSLTNAERAQVRDAFIEMDKNQTGIITLGEMKQVLSEFNIQDAQVGPIFEALNTSPNEEIHEIQYSEFLAAMVSTRIKMHDDMLTATFHRFDVDNSGYITKDNLKVVLGESFEGAEVDTLLREADRSGDGQISREEFILYIKNGATHSEHALVEDKFIDEEARPVSTDSTCEGEQESESTSEDGQESPMSACLGGQDSESMSEGGQESPMSEGFLTSALFDPN